MQQRLRLKPQGVRAGFARGHFVRLGGLLRDGRGFGRAGGLSVLARWCLGLREDA